MAHETYIGVNNIAQNVNKIWIGDNGVAKKVKRGYIGDANGIARLFFFSGYVWNRYNTKIQYRWNKNSLGTQESLVRTYTTNDVVARSNILVNYGPNWHFSNGRIYLDEHYNTGLIGSISHLTYSNVYLFTNSYTDNATEYYKPPNGYDCVIEYSSSRNQYYVERGKLDYYSVVITRGDFIEYVYSDNSSTYPINGQSGQYWYSSRTETYSQGTYIDQVESDNPSAYPNNGRGSDGYWYVKVGS